MAAAEGVGPTVPDPPAWESRNQWIAARLLRDFVAAEPKPDGFTGHGMDGGGDIPPPSGRFTYALFRPDDWPVESESALADYGGKVVSWASQQADADEEASAGQARVLTESWTAGEGREAAGRHHAKEHALSEEAVRRGEAVGASMYRHSENIRTTKRDMRQANDQAHRDIEQTLRTRMMDGGAVGVAGIIANYRPLIEEWSSWLDGYEKDEISALTRELGPLPEMPPLRWGGAKEGRGDDLPTDPRNSEEEADRGGVGRRDDPPSGGDSDLIGGPSAGVNDGGGRGDAPPSLQPVPVTPQRPQGPQVPTLPQLPSAVGGGSSPLSGAASGGMSPLSALLGGGSSASPAGGSAGGLAGSAGGVASPAAVQQASARAISSALGGEFGRGLAAGVTAAGGVGPVTPAQPIPQTPTTPLAPPAGATPVSAAPATVSMPPAAAAPGLSTGTPASAAGGGSAVSMTPYGSVLPPAPPAGAAQASPSAASLSSPAPSVVAGGGGHNTPPPGFVPGAVRNSAAVRVDRAAAETHLQNARRVVADLAAASSRMYPGLDWAVGVALGSSRMPEMWVATNEGAGYIPQGVFIPRTMPVAGLTPEVEVAARVIFGWLNPAETVVRAIKARDDTVLALATSHATRSEEVHAAVEDVATGVRPSGPPHGAEACELTRNRSHGLETVDPALYHELCHAQPAVVETYVRRLTQQVAFGNPTIVCHGGNCCTGTDFGALAVRCGVGSAAGGICERDAHGSVSAARLRRHRI
jgi:hypothetical protein